jgi:hypothetical protein
MVGRFTLGLALVALATVTDAAAAAPVERASPFPASAVVERHGVGMGATVVVSPAPESAAFALCVNRGGLADLWSKNVDLYRRGGEATERITATVRTSCVVVPRGAADFALSLVASTLLTEATSLPLEEGTALARVRALSLEGTTTETSPPSSTGAPSASPPPRTVIALVGGARAEDGLAAAVLRLGPANESRLPTAPSLAIAQTTERLSVTDAPIGAPRAVYAWLTPDVGAAEAATLNVLSEILTGGEKSRLLRLLLGERHLARAAVGAFVAVPGGTLSCVFVESTTRTSIDRVRRFVDGTLKQLRLVGPTRGEVERARERLTRNALETWEDPVRRAASLAAAESVRGDAHRVLDDARALSRVSPENVRRVVAERFVDAHRSTVEEYPPLWPADDARLARYVLYTVTQDDTLETVAKHFRVSVTNLARANDLSPQHRLTPGQGLWVPPN